MDARIEARKKDFKKSFEDPRRNREDDQLQIRKATREAHLAKKRQQASDIFAEKPATGTGAGPAPEVKLEDLQKFVEMVNSNDETAVFHGAEMIRRLLSAEHNPPIQQVVSSNIVPRFVQLLQCDDKPKLQFECAWALTNVASGTQQQTAAVIQAGAIPQFIRLMSSPATDVREQAIWALGNIAGDSAHCRDCVLRAGVMPLLLKELAQADLPSTKANIVRYGTWTLSNLCRGKPEPELHLVAPALPTLRALLYASETDILTDACWSLSYLSDASETEGPQRVDEVIKSGACSRLVELLGHASFLVQTPALRAVGNVVTGTDYQTQTMISLGVLPRLKELLKSPRKAIRKEACWAISNITAGNRAQIDDVIQHGIINDLIHILHTAEFDTKREAAWAISNAASGGNVQQVETLVQAGCMKPLCDLIDVNDTRVVTIALEAIENILRVGKQRQQDEGLPENPYVNELEQADAFEKLEKLQFYNEQSTVQKLAVRIMTTYLDVDATVEDSAFTEGFSGEPMA